MNERTQCRCLWRGERCENRATQEDGLCNWCGNGRTPEQMRDDPSAILAPDGTFLGIGGGGQLHDSRPGSPGACWYQDSDRVLVVLPCECYPDYSTPDAPSLDPNPECPQHRESIAAMARLAASYTGRDPF